MVPSSNVHQLEASAFEWKGSLPNHPSATISFAQNGLVLQAQYPMVLFPFPAGRGSTAISSTNPTGYSLRPVSGTYFFANASFNTGHTHPLSTGLHDPDDIALPPQMIRWPQESPAILPVALATPEQRNPVPPWLPAESKTLYQQGLDVLTTADILHNSNPAHWLPAYCAHALSNFAEEHLSVLANPDTLASLPTEVVDPLLRSDTSKAQEYLQGLLSAADVGYKTVLRRRPVPLTDGPPDDDYIICFNIGSLKSTRLYIDAVYRKIAELANLLAGSDIPKSPEGWVRLQTLQSYDGRDVPGNFNPTTQNVIATNKFSVLSYGNLRPMSKDVLETLLIIDFKATGKGRRFQYATYGPPAPAEGRTIKEYAVRLAPATQAAAGEGPAPPTSLAPPQYGACFCSDSMLEPLKRYGINPKTRSRDGYAIKLHPLSSCDSQAIADAIAHSPLRGPQADTLLLVDIPSTRGSHTWTLTANGLLGTYIAPIPPSHFHSAWQDPAQPMWTNPERHGTSSASVLPTYFPNVPTARDDNLNVQADGRLAAHLRETPAPHIMEEDAEPNEELTGNDFTYSHDTTTAFQELLTMIDSTTKELPDVLSTKHYAALTQLPLTYPWARLVLDMKELLLSFDRHRPSGAQALEGAVRYARPFDYQHEATTLLPNSDFLSLPDHVTQYGPVRAQTLGLHIPDSIKVWLLSGAPRIYDRTDLDLPGNRHVALPSILKRYFCSELTITQFAELLIARQAEDEKILDTAATACRKMKRAKQTLARLPHPTASSTNTGAPLAPAPMSNTPPPSPRIPDTGRSRTPPPHRPRPIGMPPRPITE